MTKAAAAPKVQFQPSRGAHKLSPKATDSTPYCQQMYPKGLPDSLKGSTHPPKGRWTVVNGDDAKAVCTNCMNKLTAAGWKLEPSLSRAHRAAVKARMLQQQQQPTE
jgi:hypothetical protein